MSGDIEAAGDLIGGALLARAVEPVAGGHGTAPPALCLNCGTRLLGPHCHRCGQSAHVHRSVGAIGHEIAHGVFHVEGKVWRTLPMLVLHPGALTRRYVDGERARFVSPLALFLFTVFLLFAAISWAGGDLAGAVGDLDSPAHQARAAGEIERAEAKLASLRASRTAAQAAGRPTADLDEQIAALGGTVDALRSVSGGLWGKHGHVTVTPIRTGWARLDEGLDKAEQNPGLALYKLQASAYKYSWLLIPLSTPFVALLFLWRRRFGLYDHAIFVTYSLCFMMLLMAALTAVGAAGLGGGWIAFAALLVPPAHMFAQLRGAYGLGRLTAAWRTVALVGFAVAVLIGFSSLLLMHGLVE